MYLIEGEENGFTSIPESIYWTIVTLTTVGYGDIVFYNSRKTYRRIIMIMGYGIIAVPTGIVSAEMAQKRRRPDTNTQSCPNCAESTHKKDNAKFCHSCGNILNEEE